MHYFKNYEMDRFHKYVKEIWVKKITQLWEDV